MKVSAARIAATISVALGASTINVGDSTQASATIRDKFGRVLWGRQVSWSSDSASVATVSSKGMVVGKSAGSSRIVARYNSVVGGATIKVGGTTQPPAPPPAPPKVASIVVTLAASTIETGKTTTAAVILKDSSNNVLTGRTVTWSSSNTAIATVDSTAKVTGVAQGAANIVATSEGVTGQAAINVTQPAPAPTPPPPPPTNGAIWRDDFETDRMASYFEVSNPSGSFSRAAGVGRNGSYGMRARFAAGQVDAGSLKLAFGRTPTSYMKPVDAGTANYREIYWRVYMRNAPGWTGGSSKLTRATIFAGSNWQEAMIAHSWGGDGADAIYMVLDPASGTDAAGNLKTTKYNDFANLRWLGAARSTTPIFDQAHSGQWNCLESHVRLNTAGQSDGLFELRINGTLEASRTGLNWVGNYADYGMNAVFLENYWNSGSPVAQERYFDDFVVSTQPIGCDALTTQPAPVASQVSITTQPSASATSGVAFAQQPVVQLRDASNNAVAQSGVVVTAAIASGGGTLGGTATATTNANGTATFSGLSITGTAGTRTLSFSSGSLSAATSAAINVAASTTTPAPVASKVTITTQPSASATSGVAFAQQPVVQLRDASNNAVAQSGVVVTAAIASGGGTLGGSTTATTSANGTASFSGLSITGTAGSRTLSFSSGSLAAATSAAINVAAATTTPPPSSGTPWLLEDFSTYTSTANMLSDPRGIYTDEDEATGNMALDNSGPPSGGKSMRYDYFDRTSQGGSGTTGRCGSFTIGRNISLPASVKDIWIEMYLKFTTNFTTAAPTSWGCTSGAGLKLMFGRVTPSSRFDIGQIDIPGNNTAGTWHGGWPGNEDAVSRNYSQTVQPYDGNWHRVRLHLKASTNGSDGAYEFWIDNVLINRSLNISTGSGTQVYGIALTRNMNQGPDHAQSLWWGGIRAYNTNPGW